MLIAGSKANRALAGAVNRRVGAEASLVAAKAWLIRCAAIGLLAIMVGAGVALGFLGYARSREANGAAERLADTLTAALERAKLHAVLDPDSSVKLDPAGAGRRWTPNATVHLADDKALPRPTRDQLQARCRAGLEGRGARRNYTVFKAVKYGTGEVVTGYTFEPTSHGARASILLFRRQHGASQSFNTLHIAADGRYIAPPGPPAGFDPVKAAQNCVWFDGKPTLF